VQYSKSKKEKSFANIAVEVFTKQNSSIPRNEILTAVREIENFLILLALKPLLV